MAESRVVQVDEEKRAALRDIETTRARMGEVVEEIEQRLSPAHFREQLQIMKEDALDQFRDAKEQVKTEIRQEVTTVKEEMREATIGRMETMMHRTTARVRGTGTSVVDAVRDNPLPLAMIGIGVGWLLASSRTDGRRRTEDERITARGVYDDWEEEPGVGAKARSFVDQGRERVSDAVDRVEERAVRARDAGLGAVRRGEDRVGDIARDNPLAVGALVFAVGAAIGLALPHTGVEDRVMGASKERAVRKAERVASRAIRRTEDEATSALHKS
ncbi:MAG: DUF3618 domain-containing protein [Polyangiaceae bacterium]|nr:DUF3618 domain-containing protein [Polyangiaceae bacterium]